MDTLRAMRTFVEIAEQGSLTAAARTLDSSLPAVVRTLAALEAHLGARLMNRTTRRIALTEEGQAFLARARAILLSVDEAEELMAARRQQPAGRLRVNAATPFMLHAIAPLAADFRAAYPQIALELDTDEMNIDLLARRTDIAIRIGALRDSTLHARPLASSRIRVLASPAYLAAAGRPTTVAALARHTLLGFTQPESLNRWPLRGAHGDEWAATPAITASSGETLRRLALAGAGIACLSDFMTAADRQAGDLVQVLARDTVDVRQPVHAVYYRNTALAARIECFLAFVEGRLRTMSWNAR